MEVKDEMKNMIENESHLIDDFKNPQDDELKEDDEENKENSSHSSSESKEEIEIQQ